MVTLEAEPEVSIVYEVRLAKLSCRKCSQDGACVDQINRDLPSCPLCLGMRKLGIMKSL